MKARYTQTLSHGGQWVGNEALERQLTYYRMKDRDQQRISNLEEWVKTYKERIKQLERQLEGAGLGG